MPDNLTRELCLLEAGSRTILTSSTRSERAARSPICGTRTTAVCRAAVVILPQPISLFACRGRLAGRTPRLLLDQEPRQKASSGRGGVLGDFFRRPLGDDPATPYAALRAEIDHVISRLD